MSMSANLHDANRATVFNLDASGGVLKFWNPDGCHLNIFMPLEKAQAMADLFNGVDRVTALTDGLLAKQVAA